MKHPLNSLEAIAVAWDERVDEYAASLLRADGRAIAARAELRHFLNALPDSPSLNLLDAGCGPGFHARHLLAHGHRVALLDASAGMLERAQQEVCCSDGRATFIRGDVRDVPSLASASFDGIFTGGTVVSDCGNPPAAVAELARLLRPSGTIGLSVRNIQGPQQDGRRTEVIPAGGPGFDWHFFSPDSLSALCGKNRLVVRSIHPILVQGLISMDIDQSISAHLAAEYSDEISSRSWELFALAEKSG